MRALPVVALVVVSLALLPVDAGATPACSDGRFVVEGRPLLPGGGVPDAVVIDEGLVSIESGCPPIAPRS